MNKNILFITHSFPAIQSANSLCDEKIIGEASKFNEGKIYVLCYRFPSQKEKEIIGNVTVYRIKKDYFWTIEGKARTPGYRNKANALLTRLITRLRQVLYLPFFPNYEPLAVNNIRKAACRIIEKESIQAVFADHNGVDTILGGERASKKKNVPFFPIFWDSMSRGKRARFVSKKYNDFKKEKLELEIIEQSKRAFMLKPFVNSEKLKYSSYPSLYKKIVFIDIPFFSPESYKAENIDHKKDKVRMVFLGNITGPGRNPKPFLDSLYKTKLNIHFDCFTADFSSSELKKYSKEYVFFHLHSPIPESQINKEIQSADILVNIGVSTPNVISAKIFTYFSTGKPVISTCPNSHEACLPYIKKYPLGFAFDDNSQSVEKLKLFILENGGKTLDPRKLKKDFAENTPEFFWQKVTAILQD